jgi:hypothetical protein
MVHMSTHLTQPYRQVRSRNNKPLKNIASFIGGTSIALYLLRDRTMRNGMPAEDQLMNLAAGDDLPAERRRGPDRRRHSWRTLTYCGLHGRGRRHQVRRHDSSYYLDRYDHGLVYTGLLVLLLSCVDAMLTLTLLDKGAYEANHLMAHLLSIGDKPFLVTKIVMTAAGVLFLLMHAHFRILRVTNGKRVLQLLAGIYGLLIAWELLLLGVIE